MLSSIRNLMGSIALLKRHDDSVGAKQGIPGSPCNGAAPRMIRIAKDPDE
jgi:hypothetical protein